MKYIISDSSLGKTNVWWIISCSLGTLSSGRGWVNPKGTGRCKIGGTVTPRQAVCCQMTCCLAVSTEGDKKRVLYFAYVRRLDGL